MKMYGRMLLWAIKSDVLLQKENDMFKFEFIYPNVRLVIKKMLLMCCFFVGPQNSIQLTIRFEYSRLMLLCGFIIIYCNKSIIQSSFFVDNNNIVVPTQYNTLNMFHLFFTQICTIQRIFIAFIKNIPKRNISVIAYNCFM